MSRSAAEGGPPENVRIRRTRTLLRNALVDLIEERGFERLTIGEITDRAMVSRAAFYRNYRDKYHLVEQIFDEAMEPLLRTMEEDAGGEPLERWTAFCAHIEAYRRFYAAMLGRDGSPWFAARMRQSLAEMTSRHLRPRSVPGTDLAPTVLGAMFVQSITWWLEQEPPLPAGWIAARTARLAAAVLHEAAAWPAAAGDRAQSRRT